MVFGHKMCHPVSVFMRGRNMLCHRVCVHMCLCVHERAHKQTIDSARASDLKMHHPYCVYVIILIVYMCMSKRSSGPFEQRFVSVPNLYDSVRVHKSKNTRREWRLHLRKNRGLLNLFVNVYRDDSFILQHAETFSMMRIHLQVCWRAQSKLLHLSRALQEAGSSVPLTNHRIGRIALPELRD